MRNIMVWHCYEYGHGGAYVMVAESQEALEAKVRESIAMDWDTESWGPMPKDFRDLIDAIDERMGVSGTSYGDWGYTVIDSTLCQPAGED